MRIYADDAEAQADGIVVNKIVGVSGIEGADAVSAEGWAVPIYFADRDKVSATYGCGERHEPDTDDTPSECGVWYCHGREGDHKRSPHE